MTKVLRFCRDSLLAGGLLFVGTSTLISDPGVAAAPPGDIRAASEIIVRGRNRPQSLDVLDIYALFLDYRILITVSAFSGLFLLLWRKTDGKVEIIVLVQCFPILPEEYVAELGVLQRRLKKAKTTNWKIQLRLLQECLSLVFTFYVRVKVENLFLPRSDRKIDDD